MEASSVRAPQAKACLPSSLILTEVTLCGYVRVLADWDRLVINDKKLV